MVRADEVRVGDLVNVRGSASEVTSVESMSTKRGVAQVRLGFAPPFAGYYLPDDLVEVVRAEAWKGGD